MCMACDEQAMAFRTWLQDATARGVVPEGVTAEDFEAVGLLVPDALRKPRRALNARTPNTFVCDSPE